MPGAGDGSKMIDAARISISLQLLISIIGGCVVTPLGVGLWINSQFGTVNTRLTLIERRLDEKGMDDRIRAWSALMQALNPTIKVPEFK